MSDLLLRLPVLMLDVLVALVLAGLCTIIWRAGKAYYDDV